MFTVRKVIPALCLAVSLSGLAVYAATTTPTPAAAQGGPHWHHGHHGFVGLMLHNLNLSDGQKTQVKSIMAGYKSQFEALRASTRTNRAALATTPPTDPVYPALLQTAQTNAATRIKLESDVWGAVYSGVLSKAQQDAIPGIVAAAQARRAAKTAAWKAQHETSSSTSD